MGEGILGGLHTRHTLTIRGSALAVVADMLMSNKFLCSLQQNLGWDRVGEGHVPLLSPLFPHPLEGWRESSYIMASILLTLHHCHQCPCQVEGRFSHLDPRVTLEIVMDCKCTLLVDLLLNVLHPHE